MPVGHTIFNKVTGCIRLTAKMQMIVTSQGIINQIPVRRLIQSRSVRNLINVLVPAMRLSSGNLGIMKFVAPDDHSLIPDNRLPRQGNLAVSEGLQTGKHPGCKREAACHLVAVALRVEEFCGLISDLPHSPYIGIPFMLTSLI